MDYPFIEIALTALLATLVSFGAAVFSVGYARIVAAGWGGRLRELGNSDIIGDAVVSYRRTLLGKAHFLLLILVSGAVAVSTLCVVIDVKFGQ